MRWANASRRRLIAWTVNDPEEARRLQQLGVHGLMSDDPKAIRAGL
ncbi:MAG: glycerophosphodiester phosphodiesterase family protein [Planctomycetota bacterium]|jgi:glycerophosphoryl diester phosphodiesterase